MKWAYVYLIVIFLLLAAPEQCRSRSRKMLSAIGKGLEITYYHHKSSGKFGYRNSYKEHFRVVDIVEVEEKKYFYARNESVMKGRITEGDIGFTETSSIEMWIDTGTGVSRKKVSKSVRKYDKKRTADIKGSKRTKRVAYNEDALFVTMEGEQIKMRQQLQLDGKAVHVLFDKTYPRAAEETPPVFMMSVPEEDASYGGGRYVGMELVELPKARVKLKCYVLVWTEGARIIHKNFYDVRTGIIVKVEGGERTSDIYSSSKELLKTNIRLEK